MQYSSLEQRPPSTDGTRLAREQHTMGSDMRTHQTAHRLHALLCIGVHLVLIAAHVALLVVCIGHHEQNVTFALVGTIWMTISVALTQSLAFRNDVYVRQTLTALHDKGRAWLGFGAACMALWDQCRLPATVLGVAGIAVYLLGVLLLHITIPAMLHVVPYNASVPTLNTTLLANFTTERASFATTYDILTVYGQTPTLGLQDNMVYDVIPAVASAVGTARVNASVYGVACAAPPPPPAPLPATTSNALTTLPQQDTNIWLLSVPALPGAPDTPSLASLPYGANVVYTAQQTSCTPGECWAPIVVISTVAVLDDAGNSAPGAAGGWAPVEPVVIPGSDTAVLITAVQLLACNVQVTNMLVDVDVNTRTPVSVPPPPPSALWTAWAPPADTSLTDQLRVAQSAPYYSPPSGHASPFSLNIGAYNGSAPAGVPPVSTLAFDRGTLLVPGNSSAAALANAALENDRVGIAVPSAFDVFLTEDLRVASENRTNVTLAEINRSVEKALAATAWYANNANYSSPHAISQVVQMDNIYLGANVQPLNLTSNNTGELGAPTGEAVIIVTVQRLRLNLSIVPIIIGLAASVVLLLVCVALIRTPRAARTASVAVDVDSGGLLEYTWLLGYEPHLAEVESPDLRNLRAAGMFEVDMADRVRRRVVTRVSTAGDKDWQ
ncbi:hypothetical protein PsYK624_003530 [Phanerochaete sordida]|uniref:Transmembrane protein n=1 Tax=Phanerochaete sordida TaxID=48140 RepID=A0A9P3FWA7_9APHY|nr:hypothetical protein PsYK624_003530 [Phanerochaete sordida]